VCLIDIQRSAVKVSSIERGDGLIPFGTVGHLHETESPGLARLTIGHNADTFDSPVGFKQ